MGEWSTLKALRAFLDANEPRLVLFLVTFWNNQERAITYKELREAILAGDIDPEWLEQWQQDYSVFVTTYLQPLWLAAIDSAANDLQEWLKANNRTDVMDWFDPVADGIKEWVSQRAAEFVTNSSQEQMDAIRAVVQRAAVMEDMTVDKLARAIRPMVGLTKQQAVANMNYYQTLLKNGISETKARDLSIRYAARQHRYRGYNIARTELSFSFNKGADDGARQAQEYGVLGDLEKVWDAAEDERTCPICGALDGQRIAMDEEFDFPTKLAATNPGIRRTPPAHPSCRCGVKYVEVTDPVIKSLECIEEVEKYNPYHDARGRFTSAPGGGSKGSSSGGSLTKENKAYLREYTSGKYRAACSISQEIQEGKQPDGDAKDIEQTKQLMKVIDSQPIRNDELVRVETGHADLKAGDVLTWGIRSTSRDTAFADKVLNRQDEGTKDKLYSLHDDRYFGMTEYHITGNKKALDVDEYSNFDQQESLVQGKFKVKSVEKTEFKPPKAQSIDDAMKEHKELQERYSEFTSKKGNPMIRDNETGKTYTPAQFGRNVYYNGEVIPQSDFEITVDIQRARFKPRTIVELEQVFD